MDGDMRIALIGQSAFGESVLNALIERGESIVGVFTPPDREGRSADPMTSAASARGIPVLQFSRMRDREAVDAFKDLNADLCVMAFVTDIIPEAILEAPTRGYYPVPSIHFAKAPRPKLHQLASHPGRDPYGANHLLA